MLYVISCFEEIKIDDDDDDDDAHNMDEAVLTSTHNLCFGAKIRKIGIPLQTPGLLYKSGEFIARTCFPDDICSKH